MNLILFAAVVELLLLRALACFPRSAAGPHIFAFRSRFLQLCGKLKIKWMRARAEWKLKQKQKQKKSVRGPKCERKKHKQHCRWRQHSNPIPSLTKPTIWTIKSNTKISKSAWTKGQKLWNEEDETSSVHAPVGGSYNKVGALQYEKRIHKAKPKELFFFFLPFFLWKLYIRDVHFVVSFRAEIVSC